MAPRGMEASLAFDICYINVNIINEDIISLTAVIFCCNSAEISQQKLIPKGGSHLIHLW